MDPLQMAGAITGAGAAAGVLGWAGRTLWRIGRSVADLHDDWKGEPDRPGVPERKGVMARLASIEDELTVNGGRSVKDAVNRIESQFAEHLRSHAATPVQVNVGMGSPADPSV